MLFPLMVGSFNGKLPLLTADFIFPSESADRRLQVVEEVYLMATT